MKVTSDNERNGDDRGEMAKWSSGHVSEIYFLGFGLILVDDVMSNEYVNIIVFACLLHKQTRTVFIDTVFLLGLLWSTGKRAFLSRRSPRFDPELACSDFRTMA